MFTDIRSVVIGLITSAKEVMFSVQFVSFFVCFVCLFVLSVNRIAQTLPAQFS